MLKKNFKLIIIYFILITGISCSLLRTFSFLDLFRSIMIDFFTFFDSYELKDDGLLLNYSINLGGDWTFFNINNYNDFDMTIDLEKRSNETQAYVKNYNIIYNNNQPYLENYSAFNTFVLKSLTNPTSKLISSSSVSNSTSTKFTFNKDYTLENKQRYTLKLNYNANSSPLVDLTLDDVVNKEVIVSKNFNYNVNVKDIQYKGDYKTNLNIVVMADGVREDQIDFYRDQVDLAFEPTGKFFSNNVIRYFKDRINILRYDTVSFGEDNPSQRILQTYPHGGNSRPNFLRVIKVINEANYGTLPKISVGDIDSIIIFVNGNVKIFYIQEPDAFCDFLYPFQITKNRQPTNFVMISENSETENVIDFHYESIIHELGHGIAELDDEYSQNLPWIEKEVLKSFYTEEYIRNKSRNLDTRTNPDEVKWKKFYDLGFNIDSNIIPELKVDILQGGGYISDEYIYRSSLNSLMNESYNYNDFNPVCAYHMVASIKTRIGDIVPYDLENNFDNPDNFEWNNYSLNQFMNDLTPDYFK